MKIRNTIITLTAFSVIALLAFAFFPTSSSAANRKYKIEPNLSVPAYKSDTVKITESYERIMGSYLKAIENHVLSDRGVEKLSEKIDTMTKLIAINDRQMNRVSAKLTVLEKQFDVDQPAIKQFNEKINSMDTRLTQTGTEFEKIYSKLTIIESKIDQLARQVEQIEKSLNVKEEIPLPE